MLRTPAILLALLTAPALAQSCNIDFGQQLTAPTALHAAAGLAGHWNVPDLHHIGPSWINDLSGAFTGVWISSQGPRDMFTNPDPLTTGNDEALMDDGLGGTGDVLAPVIIENLDPGRYRVIVYGLTGGAPNQKTHVEVENELNTRRAAATIGGAWPGAYVEGVTHASFGLTSPDGRINIYVAGGVWGQSGFSNGIQLIQHCDADLTTAAVPSTPGYGVPNGVLNNDDFFYFLARFADNDLGEADLTTTAVPGSTGYALPNGQINNDDFFFYLNLFSAGC